MNRSGINWSAALLLLGLVLFGTAASDSILINTYGPGTYLDGNGYSHYVANITVSVSSTINASYVASQIVDGSGFSGSPPAFTDANSNGVPEHGDLYYPFSEWLDNGSDPRSVWVRFDLGQAFTKLETMRLWNWYQGPGVFTNRGVQTAYVWYSSAVSPSMNGAFWYWDNLGPDWTELGTNFFTFNLTTNVPFDNVTDVSLGGISARHILVFVKSNYGGGYTGLAEVQFFRTKRRGTVILIR